MNYEAIINLIEKQNSEDKFKILNFLLEELGIVSIKEASKILMTNPQNLYKKKDFILEIENIKLFSVNNYLKSQKFQ